MVDGAVLANVAVVAGVVATGVLVGRAARRPRPVPAPVTFEAPIRVAREDFPRPDAPWLVAVFSSATCGSCAEVWRKAEVLSSDAVVVAEVEVGASPELHRRYGIAGVPITVIADAEGEVRASFVGPVSATHLWAAVAEARAPGSVPPGCGSETTCSGGETTDAGG